MALAIQEKLQNYKIFDNLLVGIEVGVAGTATSYSTWIDELSLEMIMNVFIIIDLLFSIDIYLQYVHFH